ncbi:fumarylacetoacetate hydrolase family protein [Bordetella genomosp. 13]|uniref:fumarylacetoacetate hydrolase family protein n=1 Tax=Bordetella genomosp. 13 TaxID=463040 RepID=UPI0011A13BB3|nr:fumarylacetoacetate hydrolase family protein [Bordetella genomosp. 13]
MPRFLFYDEAPYRLSGVVYGALLNQPSALEQIGDAAHEPPHKAPPKGPILYMKPRNTLSGHGQDVALPADADSLRVGATVGLVMGRTACRLSAGNALDHVAGLLLVADLTVPHDTYYRPSARFVARDGSCFLGERIAAAADPEGIEIEVSIDGAPVQAVSMAGLVRPAATLLADVTDFMTLSAGDVLLLGARIDGPRIRAGQHFALQAGALGRLEGQVR